MNKLNVLVFFTGLLISTLEAEFVDLGTVQLRETVVAVSGPTADNPAVSAFIGDPISNSKLVLWCEDTAKKGDTLLRNITLSIDFDTNQIRIDDENISATSSGKNYLKVNFNDENSYVSEEDEDTTILAKESGSIIFINDSISDIFIERIHESQVITSKDSSNSVPDLTIKCTKEILSTIHYTDEISKANFINRINNSIKKTIGPQSSGKVSSKKESTVFGAIESISLETVITESGVEGAELVTEPFTMSTDKSVLGWYYKFNGDPSSVTLTASFNDISLPILNTDMLDINATEELFFDIEEVEGQIGTLRIRLDSNSSEAVELFLINSIATPIKDINIKSGWQLLGAVDDINISKFDEAGCVDYIWKYDNMATTNADRWQLHISNSAITTGSLIYPPISSLSAGGGYWVKGNGDCMVK